MRIQVQSLALLSGIRIQRYHKLQCGSQVQLRSGMVMAVAQAGNYSSDLTPSLGTSICYRYSPKNKKKIKKRKEKNNPTAVAQVTVEGQVRSLAWYSGLKISTATA